MKKNKDLILAALSFTVPVLMAFFVYLFQGIYPGSDRTIIIYDMRSEFIAYYGYLSHGGPGFDNLIHSMSGGLGGGFVGTTAVYFSVLDLIYCFISMKLLPDVLYFMSLLRVGLCGLTFSIFLGSVMKDKIKGRFVFMLSVCYAMMSYNFAYAELPMFQDMIILLPLLALASEKIIKGKKSVGFVLLFTLGILDNYYMSYMAAIAITLYVIFRLVEEQTGLKDSFRRFVTFAVHGVLAAGLSSFLLIPVVYDLLNGKLSSSGEETSLLFIKNSFVQVAKMILPMNYSNLGANQHPYVYCGLVAVILAVAWLVLGKETVFSRITALIILCFYIASFMFGPLDRMWHGFNEPIGFSARYSYTFVFFILCFAARGISVLHNSKTVSSNSIFSLLGAALVVYVCIESFMNASYVISKLDEEYSFAPRGDYDVICEVMENSIAAIDSVSSDKYYRLAKDFNFSGYDGALFGYDGLDMFSSSYNDSLVHLYGALGLNCLNNYIKESGLTPPVASFSYIGYYLTYMNDISNNYETVGYYGPFGIFKNEYTLPFGVFLDRDSDPVLSDDPFENINKIYDDIYHITDDPVFVQQGFSSDDSSLSGPLNEYIFSPSEAGDYWFYRKFLGFRPETNVGGFLPEDLVYLNYYIDGEASGSYGFFINRYCSDLGILEKNKTYDLALDDNMLGVEDMYIYRFDKEIFEKRISEAEGFDISSIDKSGITLGGVCDTDRELLISLPFESGYEIFVNGEKREYGSYLDALITVPMKAGDNTVVIKYVPAGLKTGIIVTVLFAVLVVLYFYFFGKTVKNEEKK